MRRRSRIAGFKAPFLVSVAGPAVIGLACGSGRTECPYEVPEVGTSCDGYQTGVSCNVPYCYGTWPLVRCGDDGLWQQLPPPTCNPPPPPEPDAFTEPCSVDTPVPGSDCAYPEQECFYPGCQGPTSSWARCSFGQWLVDYSSGPACNPPAVVPVCPELEPSAGAGCAYLGQDCGYGTCEGASGGAARGYHCGDLGWEVSRICAAPAGGDAGAAPVSGLP